MLKALRAHGIDPDKKGQTIDASSIPRLQEAIFSALSEVGIAHWHTEWRTAPCEKP